MTLSSLDIAALRLAAIVESSDDAIVSKDLNGVVISWNRAAERMFGYSAEEVVGRSIRLIIPSDRQGEEDEVLASVRAGKRVEHFETVRRRKDGSTVQVSLTVSPVRDLDGTVVGASKIARDISKRKEAEAALADLDRRLVALVEASGSLLATPDLESVLSATVSLARNLLTADAYALWRVDRDGAWRVVKALEVSDEFRQRMIVAGVPGGSGRQLPFAEPLAVEDVREFPLVAGQVAAYDAEGIRSMLVFPLAITSREASLVFYWRQPRRFSQVEVQTGRALANLAATAITTAELYDQQRAYREAAEHERQRAAFLAEAGATLSASLDYEKTLAAVANLAVPHIADWCAVDMMHEGGRLQRLAVAHVDPEKGQWARTLQERGPEDRSSPGAVQQVLRTGRPVMITGIPADLVEAAARDEDHLRILRELNLTSYICVPLITHSHPFGTITFARAESGRHYDAGDLRLAEEVAAVASLAVENARAYKQANEANRLKDEFLATLSHELRTPLSAILGYTLMLRLGKLVGEQQSGALDIIERNALSLKQIIEDVLDVSRIVAGKLRLNIQPVRMPQVLNDAVTTVIPAADAKGVRIQTIIDPAASLVSGDPDRLQQIVWNLLSNAVKFTPRGGQVQVRLERAQDSDAEIVVSDTGRGVDPQFLPHMFERFRQADSRFSRDQGGLGLGLAIVREIVEMHGGTVRADSDGPGTGTTVRVRLPLMAVQQRDAGSAERAAKQTRGGSAEATSWAHSLVGVRVMVVDDEDDALALLGSILRAAGAEVRSAKSAMDALAELERELPDVLVADIGMPGMDGLDLIRRLRQSPAAGLQSLPALALTAYARIEDRVSALASGFHMHVAKPADPSELVLGVASLARRSGTRA